MRILKLLPAAILLAATAAPAYSQPGRALPHTLVYKTNADYSGLVQVELSDDGSTVASYSAPMDVNAAAAPVKLKNGYRLSRTGISLHTAFLNTTTKEYAKKAKVPAAQELYNDIKDKNPLVELWDCGTRGELSTRQINSLIRKKKLASKCKRLK